MDEDDVNKLRPTEVNVYQIDDGNVAAVYDISFQEKMEAILGILRTIFVCLVLAFGALSF